MFHQLHQMINNRQQILLQTTLLQPTSIQLTLSTNSFWKVTFEGLLVFQFCGFFLNYLFLC